MSITNIVKESMYLGDIDLKRPLKPEDIYFPGDLLGRFSEDLLTIHFLTSSTQLIIPGEYINFFQGIYRLNGDKILGEEPSGGLEIMTSLGCNFCRILGFSRKIGVKDIIGKFIMIGTKELREYLKLKPWTLKNINQTIDL